MFTVTKNNSNLKKSPKNNQRDLLRKNADWNYIFFFSINFNDTTI